jgi:putative flippase GtrA
MPGCFLDLSYEMPKLFCFKELGRYSIAGISSTLLDWAIFYLLITFHLMHYQMALFIALSLSSVLNYKLNKHFTFKSNYKKGVRQFATYFILVMVSLLLSFICMHILVSRFALHAMPARIITTALLAISNYLLTKHISFNHRLFKDAA